MNAFLETLRAWGIASIVAKQRLLELRQNEAKKFVPPLVWKPSIDIIIPHRASEPNEGLELTIRSCESALRNTGIDYRYYIVNNGDALAERDCLNRCLDYVRQTGRVGKIFDVPEPLSPPAARTLGVSAGTGEVLFFFDDHVDAHPDFFHQMLHTMNTTGCAAVHGKMYGLGGDPSRSCYHYRLTLEENFWGHNIDECGGDGINPYRIAHGNHGAFCLRRSVWDEVGGYWDGFVGWGGEEPQLNFALALLDHHAYLNPLATHWHHFTKDGQRTYTRFKDDCLFNFLCAANIIGGEQWARKIIDNKLAMHPKLDIGLSCLKDHPEIREKYLGNMHKLSHLYDDVLDRAKAKSAPAAEWMRTHRKRTLDEQLQLWKRENVAH